MMRRGIPTMQLHTSPLEAPEGEPAMRPFARESHPVEGLDLPRVLRLRCATKMAASQRRQGIRARGGK